MSSSPLSRDERTLMVHVTDSDRLAFLDANKVSLEAFGITIYRDSKGWRTLKWSGPDMTVQKTCSTLREAIDALMEAQ